MASTEDLPRMLNDGRYVLEDRPVYKSKHGTWVFYASDTTSQRKLIVKYIDVVKNDVSDEIETMQMLDHERLLKNYDIVELPHLNIVALVQERMMLGDLLDYINKDDRIHDEDIWMKAFYPVAKAFKEMHDNNVIHRDIKLDNIFFKDTVDGVPYLVVGDFGFSKLLQPGEMLEKPMGTLHYLAPELINKEPYSFPVDVWAFGVTLYIVLVGKLPYDGDEITGEYYSDVINENIDVENENFTLLSESAQELILSCLSTKPDERITFEGIVAHDWFSFK
jgi:serine/threonine protein kinase